MKRKWHAEGSTKRVRTFRRQWRTYRPAPPSTCLHVPGVISYDLVRNLDTGITFEHQTCTQCGATREAHIAEKPHLFGSNQRLFDSITYTPWKAKK